MNKRKVDNWLEGFMECTDNSEAHPMFRRWTAISAIASVLRRKCFMQHGVLTFYPNMYIVLVGPPATRKGTAFDYTQDMLHDLGIKMSSDSTTLRALMRDLSEANDMTTDECGLHHTHSSLTIFSREFTVFLGYKNMELISVLCDWYDCKRVWKHRTSTQGEDIIKGVWVNLIGATTPSQVAKAMPLDAEGAGLTSRIVFVCEPRKYKTVPLPNMSPGQLQIYKDLRNDLEKINLLSGQFKYTKKYLELWSEWYTVADNSPPKLTHPLFESYNGRRMVHVMKLSMILAAARADCRSANKPDMLVTEVDLQKAIDLIEATEVNMPQVFSGVGRSNISDMMPKVMAVIGNKKEIGFWELLRIFHLDLDKFGMERVIDTLEASKFITKTHDAHQGLILRYVPLSN